MKPKNYHPIFSDAPTHMGGMYLLQSLKQQVNRNASLKRLHKDRPTDFSAEKQFHKVESTTNLKLQGEAARLPNIKFKKSTHTKTLLNRNRDDAQAKKTIKEEGIYGLVDKTRERGSFRGNSQTRKSTFIAENRNSNNKKRPDLDNVLNCSSLENEQDFDDNEGTKNADLIGKKDYIKNAKSYKIDELGETNDSFMESTVPVQKLKHCLNLLGGNFTQHNLTEYAIESNIIIDQPFYYIKKTKALREVSLLIMALIKYNLITEEVKFINAISILLQSFAHVTAREDSSPKFVNRFFDSLESLVDLNMSPLVQYFYLVVEFLNGMTENVSKLPESVPQLFLKRSFDLMAQIYLRMLQVADEEADLCINQFLKVSEKNPWIFVERITEDPETRAIILQNEELLTTFARLVQDFLNVVLGLQETDFTGIKKAVVYSDMFGVAFAALKNQEVRKKLSEIIPADLSNLSKMIEFLLSSIIQITYAGQLIEQVEIKMERNLQLAQKTVQGLGYNKSLEVEDLIQLFFRLLCDKSTEMASPKRIEFATELALLMKEIAFARKDSFIKAFKHNRKNLDSIVFTFNTASAGTAKKDFARQKDQFLRPVIDIMSLLKSSSN